MLQPATTSPADAVGLHRVSDYIGINDGVFYETCRPNTNKMQRVEEQVRVYNNVSASDFREQIYPQVCR